MSNSLFRGSALERFKHVLTRVGDAGAVLSWLVDVRTLPKKARQEPLSPDTRIYSTDSKAGARMKRGVLSATSFLAAGVFCGKKTRRLLVDVRTLPKKARQKPLSPDTRIYSTDEESCVQLSRRQCMLAMEMPLTIAPMIPTKP